MITTTHIVTNAFLARMRGGQPSRLGRLLSDTTRTRTFIIGGFAPDVGLYLLTIGAAIFYPLARDLSLQDAMRLAFDDLFYNEPLWIIAQNTLHSPVIVFGLVLVAWRTGKLRLLSFALGCLVHVAIDIPVHHDDGPLVLFPFDWNTRVISPVSYWDNDHFGNIVGPIDLAVTLIGGTYLLATWWRTRRALPEPVRA